MKISIETLKNKLELEIEYYDELCLKTEQMLIEAQQNQYILEGIMKNIEELKNDIILIENNQNK
jgi:BioD-like phosphotransacetylase family protein